jgi:hypothetical protein
VAFAEDARKFLLDIEERFSFFIWLFVVFRCMRYQEFT